MHPSSKNKCIFPSSSFIFIFIVPSWTGGPVPFSVVSLLVVFGSLPGTNLRRLLQIWPVLELSQTKNIESVSNSTWVLSFSTSASAKLVVKPWRRLNALFLWNILSSALGTPFGSWCLRLLSLGDLKLNMLDAKFLKCLSWFLLGAALWSFIIFGFVSQDTTTCNKQVS